MIYRFLFRRVVAAKRFGFWWRVYAAWAAMLDRRKHRRRGNVVRRPV